MKIFKNILLIALFVSVSIANAQQEDWQKTLGGIHADYLYDAMPTLDYGFIMVGGTLSNNNGDVDKNLGDYDYFVTKLSEFGRVEWTKTIGGTGIDVVKSITNTYDGGYLLAGTSTSSKINEKTSKQIGGQDIWLVKIDIKGNVTWQKTLGGIATDDVTDVIRTQDGGFVIAGSSASDEYYLSDKAQKEPESKDLILKSEDSKGNLDFWVVKIDGTGEEKWQRTIGGKYKDELRQVAQLEDGSIVLGGVSNSPMGQDKNTVEKGLTDWWVIKVDKEGNDIWQKAFGDDGDDQLYSMQLNSDQEIIIGGNSRNYSAEGTGNSDFVVIKLDKEGELITENTYSEGTNDVLTDIVLNKDGTYLISGYTQHQASNTQYLKKQHPKKGTEDFIAIKINAEGEELWRKTLGTDKKEVLRKSIETRDGGYVLMGSSMPFRNTGTNDANFWIVKLLDKDKPTAEKIAIESVPNPTNDYTTIVIAEEYTNGVVRVFNFNGNLIQSFKIDGRRMIPINLETYPDGVYIVSVEANGEQFSTKIIKVRH